MKLRMAIRHLKDVYPIVWKNWPVYQRRYMVREYMWFSHARGVVWNLNRFEE